MRLRIVWIIFRKELTETLRDWRTLLMMAGLPAVLYPLLFMGGSQLQQIRAHALAEQRSTVAIWGELPAELATRLRERADLTAVDWLGAPPEVQAGILAGTLTPAGSEPAIVAPPGPEIAAPNDPGAPEVEAAVDPLVSAARALLGRREADAVVVPTPGFRAAVEGERVGRVVVWIDFVRPASKQAGERVKQALREYRDEVVKRRHEQHGLAEGFSLALEVTAGDIMPLARVSGDLLGSAVACLLVLMALMGGVYPAIDLTAGEKERCTMETLLCVPLRSTEIIAGKFLAVWAISVGAGLANLLSIALMVSRLLVSVGGAKLMLDPGSFVLIFVLYLPVAFTTSAVFLAVGVFARDFKDGQNLVVPVYILFALPSGAVMLPGIELTPATAFAPILNMTLLVKAMLTGEARADLVFLALTSSAAWAALAVGLAAKVFECTPVLLGGRESLRATLGLERRGGLPSPQFAILSTAALLVVLFYGSLGLERVGMLRAVLTSQILLLLLPTLGLIWAFGFPVRRTLALHRPTWRGVAGSALVGASAWVVIAGSVMRWITIPPELTRELEQLVKLGGDAPLWLTLAVVAVLPAVCEEVLFRGLVLTGLRRWGRVRAIGATALLFGLFHASLYRLLPTLALGLVLGWLVWRTGSIVCGMVAHALNNGIVVLASQWPDLGHTLGMAPGGEIPVAFILVAAMILGFGLLLVRSGAAATTDAAAAPTG